MMIFNQLRPNTCFMLMLAFASFAPLSGHAQSIPYPGPIPNQPPANAPLESAYRQPGPYSVSKLIGVLDTSGNVSYDQFDVAYPCTSLTTDANHLGNASNFPNNTVPYDIWYPSNLRKGNSEFPVIVFGGGFNPPPNYIDPQGRPVSSDFRVTPDNADAVDYLLSHLASWGFVVIATQSGLTGSGLQDICAAEYAVYIQNNSDPLVMVQEVAQKGPSTMSGIDQQGSSVSNVPINETTPAMTPVTVQVNGTTTVVGGAYQIYQTRNPFYGALNVNEIGVIGHSEGAYGVVNALIDGRGVIKTAVPLEIPIQAICNTPLVATALGYTEPADNVCQATSKINSGSIFFVNGSQDWVISPSSQIAACWLVGEQSDSCLYSDVPNSVPKAWATLIGANHQDPGGSPWCVTYVESTSAASSQPYPTAIDYWTAQGLPPDPAILQAPPATATPCGTDESSNASLGNNPEYGGVFGYLGYVTAWFLSELQNDQPAHSVFVNSRGELFTETANWQNQISNIPQ